MKSDKKLRFFLKIFISFIFIFGFISCKSFPYSKDSYTLEEVLAATKDSGFTGIIHGADHLRKFYVITWSHPTDFFNRHNIVIAPTAPLIAKQFAQLNRGDTVFVRGKSSINKGQAHLLVETINISQKYQSNIPHTAGEYSPQTSIPNDLLLHDRQIFYIHSTSSDNSYLILEYGDAIVPMIVKQPDLIKNLYRGDYVELKYKIDKSIDNPHRPTHLVLDDKANNPVNTLDSILKLHDQELTLTGRLVLFPKSPTINRNIFAVEVPFEKFPTQPPRYFTIVPKKFDNENFTLLLKKIDEYWQANPQNIYKGRNKFIHLDLIITVKGRGNVVSPNQANGQIFTDLENISISGGNKTKVK